MTQPPIEPPTMGLEPSPTVSAQKPIATQSQYPLRAVLRTILAVALATIALLNAVAPVMVNAVGDSLPASTLLKLNAIAAGIAVVSGAVTRVMAIPMVDDWLRKLGVSATP